MRKRFARRKRSILLCAMPFLLAGGITLFRTVEHEQEIFTQKMRTLIETKLAESLALQVSLGRIRIGTFQEVVLENLSFRLPEGSSFLDLPQVRLHRKGKRVKEITFKNGRASWKGINVNRLKGELSLAPDSDPQGTSLLLEKAVIEGTLQEKGKIRLSLRKKNLLAFQGEITLQDFRWGERRLSGSGKVFFLARDRNHPWQDFKVKTAWHQLTLEEVPLENAFGHFSVDEKTLFIEHMHWGRLLSFSGKVTLTSPYETEGRLHFFNFDRQRLAHFLRNPSRKIPQSVEGQLFFHGPLRKLHINGHLVAYEGKMKDIDYQKANCAFRGQWPVVTVELRLEREFPEESSMTVLGLVDLAKLGQKGFYETLALEEADAVVWKGVALQSPSKETLVFGKGNDTTSVSLKTFLNNELPQEEEEGEFELEYRLRKGKSFKMRFKGDEEFLGLERKLHF